MNRKGYTLLELLAVIAVLSIIIGISVNMFSNVQKNILESDYDNLISYIETSAEQFANDTGIYGTITVQDLIDAGYVTADDSNKIYNPVDNSIINCKKLEIIYDNDDFKVEYKKDEDPIMDEQGNCLLQENEQALVICKLDGTMCNNIDSNKWYNSAITIGVRNNEGRITSANSFLWKPSGASTATIDIERSGIYSVDVKMSEDALTYGRATKEIKIDKVPPVFSKIESNKVYYKDEDSGINQICFFSDDVLPSTCAEAMNNSTTKDCESATNNSRTIKTGTTFACATDNAGNYSTINEVITDNSIDEITLTQSPLPNSTNNNYVKELTLTGSAKDSSGIVKYQLNNSSSVGSWQTTTITNNFSKSFPQTLSNDVESEKVYYFRAMDNIGNIDVATLNIKIDTKGPTYSSGGTVSNGSITEASFTDGGSGLKKTYYYVLKNDTSTPDKSKFTKTTRTYTYSSGNVYYAWALAEDKLGNYTIKYLGSYGCKVGSWSCGSCSSDGWKKCTRTVTGDNCANYSASENQKCYSDDVCGSYGSCSKTSDKKTRKCYYYYGGVKETYSESTRCYTVKCKLNGTSYYSTNTCAMIYNSVQWWKCADGGTSYATCTSKWHYYNVICGEDNPDCNDSTCYYYQKEAGDSKNGTWYKDSDYKTKLYNVTSSSASVTYSNYTTPSSGAATCS